MADQEIKRQTAYKCNIATLNNGTFVKKEGWESNYIMTEYGDFSRVNVMAVVVGKDENSIVVDDGSGQLSGRMFDKAELLQDIKVGSVVLIVGRPREFNNKIYLTIELVKEIDPGWVNYRRKELLLMKKVRNISPAASSETRITPKAEPEIVESASTLNVRDKVVKIVSELDKGEGALIEDVVRLIRVSNIEEIIEDMMMRGDIYESKAGKIKLM